MNKKSAQKSRQDCERPIDSVKLIPHKVRKSPMPRYYIGYRLTIYCQPARLTTRSQAPLGGLGAALKSEFTY